MMLAKTISTSIDKLKRRVIKTLGFGNNDVQTSLLVAPYGDDSNPIPEMVALYSKTTAKDKTVIVGYINRNQLAGVGEKRLFSTDDKGNEKFYLWIKNDATIEIGGNSNFAVKFNELKTEFNKFKTNFNNHITEYDAHVHTGGTISGSTGITTPSTNTNSSDIDNAKNDKIKTI